jgi:hypothetical protein
LRIQKAMPGHVAKHFPAFKAASEATFPVCTIGIITTLGVRFFRVLPARRWQCKNPKTYAQQRCEQVVGKIALKWVFGSQLLRLRSVLSRHRRVLSHVAGARLRGARRNFRQYPLAANGLYVFVFGSLSAWCCSTILVTARRRREGEFDMLKKASPAQCE